MHLDTIKDWKNDKYDTKAISATIVGGENVVSKETEAFIKSKLIVIDRVNGVSPINREQQMQLS